MIILTKSKKKIYIVEGSDDSLEGFFKAVEILGTVKDLAFRKLEYKECDIISDLTCDQKKILNCAKKYGYYDYPRKITSEELSEKIGVDKDITLENLRKAEKRIISRIVQDN